MIDWAVVGILQDEIGQDAFEEVVQLFLEEISAEIEALTTDATTKELEARFHVLKGSAVNLGFAEFANLCGAAETAAAAGTPTSCDISSIIHSYETSKKAFLSGLNMQKAG